MNKWTRLCLSNKQRHSLIWYCCTAYCTRSSSLLLHSSFIPLCSILIVFVTVVFFTLHKRFIHGPHTCLCEQLLRRHAWVERPLGSGNRYCRTARWSILDHCSSIEQLVGGGIKAHWLGCRIDFRAACLLFTADCVDLGKVSVTVPYRILFTTLWFRLVYGARSK